MQILQWLFKNANDTNFNTNSSKKEVATDEETNSKDIVLFGISLKKRNRAGKSGKSSCKILNLLNTLRRKDIATDYFYSTIRLKRLGSSQSKQQFVHCMKMKKQSLIRGLSFRRKADSGTAKVLPVSDAVRTAASENGHKEQNFSADKKTKANGDKIKTVSKMKELIKWAAAAAKSQKGGKYFGPKILQLHDRSNLKTVPDDDDQFNYDSPKISLRWDVDQSYSAISVNSLTKNDQFINSNMVYIDQCPAATRKGNWVTTDSEFVVLELEQEL